MTKTGNGLGMLVSAVLVSVVLFSPLGARASDTEAITWESDYRTALESARASGKPLVVKITSTACPQCARLESETMNAEAVVDVINTSYVSLALDAEKDADLIAKFRVDSVPATLIVAPDRRIVRRVEGFVSADEMQSHMTSAIRDASRQAVTTYFPPTGFSSGSS